MRKRISRLVRAIQSWLRDGKTPDQKKAFILRHHPVLYNAFYKETKQ